MWLTVKSNELICTAHVSIQAKRASKAALKELKIVASRDLQISIAITTLREGFLF